MIAAPPLPPGRALELPGRGTTWVWEHEGPAGAPTLLLLHGWTATAALNWFAAMPALGEHYHVVAMDLRGHGRGIRSRMAFQLEDCADDAAAVCEVLGLSHVTAVGYSMGGPICQLLWRRHRQLVDGLVLCATAGLFSPPHPLTAAVHTCGRALERVVAALPEPARRGILAQVLRSRLRATPLSEWAAVERRPHDLGALIGAAMALTTWSSQEWLMGIDVPVAVVKTEADELVAPSRQQEMADSIAGAKVFPIDADHGACTDRPDLFVPALLAACEAVARPAAGVGPAADRGPAGRAASVEKYPL